MGQANLSMLVLLTSLLIVTCSLILHTNRKIHTPSSAGLPKHIQCIHCLLSLCIWFSSPEAKVVNQQDGLAHLSGAVLLMLLSEQSYFKESSECTLLRLLVFCHPPLNRCSYRRFGVLRIGSALRPQPQQLAHQIL